MRNFENQDKRYHAPKNKSWAIGETVMVGFLSLTVTGYSATGTYLQAKSGATYHFVPYHGLERLS